MVAPTITGKIGNRAFTFLVQTRKSTLAFPVTSDELKTACLWRQLRRDVQKMHPYIDG
jgi:hypothetical protein